MRRHRVEINLFHVTQVLVEFVCEPQFFSVIIFVLIETKLRPLLWRFSLPLFWIHMRGAPPLGEGCGTRPTLPHIFFHFDCPVIPLFPSPAIVEGSFLSCWLLFWSCGQVSVFLYLGNVCGTGRKWELWGRKAILLFRCIMFICENELVALDGPGKEAGDEL